MLPNEDNLVSNRGRHFHLLNTKKKRKKFIEHCLISPLYIAQRLFSLYMDGAGMVVQAVQNYLVTFLKQHYKLCLKRMMGSKGVTFSVA